MTSLELMSRHWRVMTHLRWLMASREIMILMGDHTFTTLTSHI